MALRDRVVIVILMWEYDVRIVLLFCFVFVSHVLLLLSLYVRIVLLFCCYSVIVIIL